MKIAIIAMTLLCLTGCAELTTAAAPKLAKAVNKYCAEPYQSRLLLRNQVNGMIKPNAVKVSCEGDPE